MANRFKDLVNRLTLSSSRKPSPSRRDNNDPTRTTKATTPTTLFTPTDPAIDGEDCLHDCETCTIHLPPKWSIDESDDLYGHVNGWSTHLLVATGKTDWVRDVSDEKGSVMEAVGKYGQELGNGKVMLSACDMGVPEYGDASGKEVVGKTRVLVLPRWEMVEGVTPALTPAYLKDYVANLPTNDTPLTPAAPAPNGSTTITTAPSPEDPSVPVPVAPPAPTLPAHLTTTPLPHNTLILLCSQRTRDARCGQSAPLLKREFERHLRPLGLYRDSHDERPGGVGIYFISHVGGHKYAANCMIYRRAGTQGAEMERVDGGKIEGTEGEAAQCIWLARIRPEDCENIVRYTVCQGKVVKPNSQLRGGFDRGKGLVSW